MTNLKKKWKWLTGFATIGVAAAVLLGGPSVVEPPLPIVFNDHIIQFPYTDENVGEDLLIYTNQETYSSWDKADVYFAVNNISGQDQMTQLQVLFKGTEDVAAIYEYKPQVSYQVEIPNYEQKETCESYIGMDGKEAEGCYFKETGTHMETRYKDEWGVVNFKTKGDLLVGKQEPVEFKAKKQSEYWIPAGETKYFKAVITFSAKGLQPSRDEFYIKAQGHNGAFGLLDPWYDNAWGYRREITINSTTKVATSSTLSNFVFTISTSTITDLKFTGHSGKVGQADGGDILFTKSDGSTKLSHEIEKYASSTGETVAHVFFDTTVPTSTNLTLYVYYGNASAADQWDTPDGSNDVWDSNFKTVYHLEENAANTTVSDSTSNVGTGTAVANTNTMAIAGQINSAFDFNGSSEYVTASGTLGNIVGVITVCGWVNDANDGGRVVSHWGDTQAEQQWVLEVTSGDKAQFARQHDFGTYEVATGATSLSTVTWYYICGIYDGGTTRVYLNGIQDGSDAGAANAVSTSHAVRVGYEGDGSGTAFWEGPLDEIRISNTNRSVAWMRTEYLNHSNFNAFHNFGAEESAPVAAPSGRRRPFIIN